MHGSTSTSLTSWLVFASKKACYNQVYHREGQRFMAVRLRVRKVLPLANISVSSERREESMKRRKKGRHSKTWANRRQESSRQRRLELEPEDFASYVRQAEKEVLPIIKDMQLGPGAAQLVLALHAQMLVTGDPRVTPESMMAAGNSVLALWQAGYYTPRPADPFTLEETLRDAA